MSFAGGGSSTTYKATSYALYLVEDEAGVYKLSDVISTLPSTNDSFLKKFIESRLSRGSVFAGSGQVSPIDLGIEPASCYFSLLNATGDGQYVVCFVTESNRVLESFRVQLDQHAGRVEAALKASSESDVSSTVKPLLESWYKDCLLFVVNCVQTLGKDIKYVVYNAAANGQMLVDTDDHQLKTDLERFHANCTLSDLLNQSGDSESDTSGSMVDVDAEPRMRSKQSVDILCITCHNGEAVKLGENSTSKFCDDWAQVLFEKLAYSLAENGDVNPADLKTINENFKLKTIQDMNTLKRLVKQAELDFYSLYRSYIFIRKSGNSSILLMHAMNEEQNPDSLSILNLLKDYCDGLSPQTPLHHIQA